MRLVVLISLALTVACGAAPAPSETAWSDDDLDVADPLRADGPAERARPLPPNRPAEYSPRKPKRAARRFSGRRIDFDVKDADLHNVFRLLADVGNFNIVVGDGVSGAVTMRLRNVPWDQILDTVVRTKGLHMEVSGNVIMITERKP